MDFEPFRQRLSGGPPECQESAPSLDPNRETFTDRGGRPASVRNFLLVSGVGGVTIWGGDLVFVSGNVQEAGGGEHGFPQTGDGSEGQVVEGRDLEKRSSGKSNQVSGKTDTEDVH